MPPSRCTTCPGSCGGASILLLPNKGRIISVLFLRHENTINESTFSMCCELQRLVNNFIKPLERTARSCPAIWAGRRDCAHFMHRLKSACQKRVGHRTPLSESNIRSKLIPSGYHSACGTSRVSRLTEEGAVAQLHSSQLQARMYR